MSSQFHTASKKLNRIDTTLPCNLVKGAVLVERCLYDSAGPDHSLSSTYVTINKETDDIADLIVRLAEQLKLSHDGNYGLVYDDQYLCNKTLGLLKQGFMLTLTHAPEVFVSQMKSAFNSRRLNTDSLDRALINLAKLSQDKVFGAAFLGNNALDDLYNLIVEDFDRLSTKEVERSLQSIYNLMELNLPSLKWSMISISVLECLCRLVTGRAKIEDASAVQYAESSIEQILNSDDPARQEIIFDQVVFQCLIRHLDRSDERVCLATLSLMNALHRKASAPLKAQNKHELSTAPFRNAISRTVLRGGRVRDSTLLDQLVPLQKIMLDTQLHLAEIPATRDDFYLIENIDVVKRYLPMQALDNLQNNQHQKLLFRAIYDARDKLVLMATENSMRAEKSRWELVPICEQSLYIVRTMLMRDDVIAKTIVFLFSVESPVFVLFQIIVQLYHKTWHEMQAVADETQKVSKVVNEQISRAVEKQPDSVQRFEADLAALPYKKLQEIWKLEESERETAELESDVVRELRTLIRPNIEQLIRQNRKNFMKQGCTFKKAGKKALLKDATQFFFWKLDAAEKILIITDCDTERFVPDVNIAKSSRKIVVKDIIDVQWGDENDKGTRKSSSFSRAVRILLPGADGKDDVIAAHAHNDQDMKTWVDGLCELIGKNDMSQDTKKLVDRLLATELRLRLVQVPNPTSSIECPPLPTSWDWIPRDEIV